MKVQINCNDPADRLLSRQKSAKICCLHAKTIANCRIYCKMQKDITATLQMAFMQYELKTKRDRNPLLGWN